MIRLRRTGQTHSETFSSLAAAKLKAEQLHNEHVQGGLDAFSITPAVREEAKEALKLIGGRASIVDAVRFWRQHHPDGAAVTLAELVESYLTDMTARKCRPLTISGARWRLKKLCVDYGDRPASSITESDMRDWLEAKTTGGQNLNNYRATFRACFTFAVKRNIIAMNPLAGIERIRLDWQTPAHWTTARVEALLKAAAAFRPEMEPVLSVMAFAGLRPFEAARLDWGNVNLTERIVRVMPGTSKVRASRLVDIADNLAAWLAPHRKESGPVAPPMQTLTRWRVRLAAAAVLGVDKVRERLDRQKGMKGTEIKAARLTWTAMIEDARKADADLWPVDVLRHTFATFHLAEHNDIGKLAEQMGSSAQVIRTHYKGLATAKEAAKYWKIKPKGSGKVIRLREAAG